MRLNGFGVLLQFPSHDRFSDASGGGGRGADSGGFASGSGGGFDDGRSPGADHGDDGDTGRGRTRDPNRGVYQSDLDRQDRGRGRSRGSRDDDRGAGQQPVVMRDDQLVDFGDGKPITWAEARKSRYMPKDAYDRGVSTLFEVADELETRRLALERGQGQGQGQRQQQQPQQRVDPLADIRDAPVISGKQLATLYEQLQAQGMTPLANLVGQLYKQNQELMGQMKTISAPVSQYAEQQAESQHMTMLGSAITELGEVKGFRAPIEAQDLKDFPELLEVARDVYDSHDKASWRPGEFGKILRARLEAFARYIRTNDARAVTRSQERLRANFDVRRGTGRGNGRPQYVHQSSSEIAEQAREAGFFQRAG